MFLLRHMITWFTVVFEWKAPSLVVTCRQHSDVRHRLTSTQELHSDMHRDWRLSGIRTLATLYTKTMHYLLTPWSRVLLEKLTGSAAIQDIRRIFGTRMFLTILTSARHLSLSSANSIQSPQPPPTSWRSILILSSHLRLGLPNGLFLSGFPTRTLCNKVS